jgi:hypothetical protein
MAPRPQPWSAEQVAQVKGLLSSFNGDVETVCAVMDCRRDDLNWLCRQAFGPSMTFAKAVHKYELVGKARLKSALFKAAEDGNTKALDMLAREHLEMMGPVERRRKVAKEMRDKQEETDF